MGFHQAAGLTESGMADSGGAEKQDPMGVRRRWGRRELVLLVGAVLVILLVALLVQRRLIGRPPQGAPVGVVPGMRTEAAPVPPR